MMSEKKAVDEAIASELAIELLKKTLYILKILQRGEYIDHARGHVLAIDSNAYVALCHADELIADVEKAITPVANPTEWIVTVYRAISEWRIVDIGNHNCFATSAEHAIQVVLESRADYLNADVHFSVHPKPEIPF